LDTIEQSVKNQQTSRLPSCANFSH